MKYFLNTLGCQMNYSDSERVAAVLDKMGHSQTLNPADTNMYIFNTCSIRKKAEDRVLGKLRLLKMRKKADPSFKIGITGCMVEKTSHFNSETKDKLIKELECVDFVFRIDELNDLPELLTEIDVTNIDSEEKNAELANYFEINPKYNSKFQAFVPIAKGCDNFCSYCIVPHTRGREISRRMEDIINEVKGLALNGCLEITLLGQNVDSYGLARLDRKAGHFLKYKKPPFVVLLEELNKIEGIKRIYFTSSHPKDMSDELIEALGTLPKMTPYVHLPVQSGDNKVLRRMNRFYTRDQFLEIWRKLKNSIGDRLCFSTDIIVGFCGETEEEFMNTYKLFEEIEFDLAFIAQFSMRDNTLASRAMTDELSDEVKSRRFHMLNDLLRKNSFKKNQAYLGNIEEVLVHKINRKGALEGRTDSYKQVLFEGPPTLVGKMVNVKITKTQEWNLIGELV